MPVTRSHKMSVCQEQSAAASTDNDAMTTGTEATTSEQTSSTYATIETDATPTTDPTTVVRREHVDVAQGIEARIANSPRPREETPSESSLDVLKAQLELLTAKIALMEKEAATRQSLCEESSQITTDWVRSSFHKEPREEARAFSNRALLSHRYADAGGTHVSKNINATDNQSVARPDASQGMQRMDTALFPEGRLPGRRTCTTPAHCEHSLPPRPSGEGFPNYASIQYEDAAYTRDIDARPKKPQTPPPTCDAVLRTHISTYAASVPNIDDQLLAPLSREEARAFSNCPLPSHRYADQGGAHVSTSYEHFRRPVHPNGPLHASSTSPPPRCHGDEGGPRASIEARPYKDGHRVNEPVHDSSIDNLAAAITAAAARSQPMRMQELPIYNGSSSDWLPFRLAYEESARQHSEQDNLARLRRSLKGKAKEAAHCLFVGATTADEVMKLLTSTFGRPDALSLAELDKLTRLPRLSERPGDICDFATNVVNTTATLKALRIPHLLHNAGVVRAVVDKLPFTLRDQYYDFKERQFEHTPDLVVLAEFMQRTATRHGAHAPAENIPVQDRRGPPTRKAVRTYHANVRETKPVVKKTVTCPVCKQEGHRVAQCSQMKEAAVAARWDIARECKLCFRCLQVRGYRHACKTKKCDIDGCEHRHHELLHSAPPAQEREAIIVTSTRERSNGTLLKVLPVRVKGPRGECDTYALLDDGSTCSIVEAWVADKIGATGTPAPFYIQGVGGAQVNATESCLVNITLCGRVGTERTIALRTIKDLQLSPQTVPRDTVRACPHLQDIEEHLVYEECSPTILLGQDNWELLLTHAVRRGTDRHQPVATLTDMGWVLHGVRGGPGERANTFRSYHLTAHESEESMERMMRDHFALESLAVAPKRSYTDDERRALQQLEGKTRRLPAGGFETGLLWRNKEFSPPDSYDVAHRRLELVEKKLNRDEGLKNRYQKQLQTLIDNDYAEIAPPRKNNKVWYLPHFAVINPQKPDKLRLVHDAAARARGVSLNDMLLPGPDLLQSLPGVLMRFRQRAVAVTADIKDMFLRVAICEEDRDMQRFLWRGCDQHQRPTEYRMKCVIFGATSSPCTAIYVKDKNAEHFKEEYPEATAAIVSNHYVDDYLASFDDEDTAVRISSQVMYIHSRANYFLQRWASNSRQVLSKLSPGTEGSVLHLDDTKTLGMVWKSKKDTLSFNLNEHKIPASVLSGEKTPTKREALRTTMSIFDPMGLATPVTIQAKRIIQETWRSGIEWDTQLETPEADSWKKWLEEARLLPQLEVPRCYTKLAQARTIEMHTFVDASSSAYAAVVYWRVIDKEGNVHISLIIGKGKVAPLKLISIPRLELQAAVLGCRLTQTVVEEHQLKATQRYYWTDSRTVLTWIRKGPRTYKPFVAHRVAEIAEHTRTKEWRWIPTKMNVADDATRDVPPDFNSNHRWFRGPDFLHKSQEEWPQEETTEVDNTNEERVHHINSGRAKLIEALPSIARFSNWMRLMRTTARVLQFIERLRTRKQLCAALRKKTRKHADVDPTWRNEALKKKTTTTRATGGGQPSRKYVSIDVEHLQHATTLWLRAQQEEVFNVDIAKLRRGAPLPPASRLKKLSVVLDEGVIRLRSRITAASDITDQQRSPAVIDGDHPWARLYIAWVHLKTHHGGFGITTSEVRQHYWLLRLRNAVRSQLKRCRACRIARATPPQPSTGDHPPTRLAHHQRPFTFTGLDFFGPMLITVGRSRQKRYGVIFTCLTTRAVHVEVAGDLSTDAAIMTLRRFIARRGCPTELWSDQGTNLRGADAELRKAAQEAMEEDASVRFIKWRYIPPSAPFMGGAWERLVRSVKTSLNTVLHERAPREDVLHTLLVEVEHTLNSRPLTHVSTAPDDEGPLTPNHFLLGGPSRVPQPGAFTDGDIDGRRMWRTCQRLADMFWARWIRDYMPELQHRRDPRAKNGALRLGNLVFIADGTLPRNVWPRGVIVATYPGPDGEIRAVDVRTSRGVLRRPTKKLVIIATEDEQ